MVQGRIVAALAGIDELPCGVVDPTFVVQAWLSAMTLEPVVQTPRALRLGPAAKLRTLSCRRSERRHSNPSLEELSSGGPHS